jgi:hypothetical protein
MLALISNGVKTMMNTGDLRKQVSSLDMIIKALSDELVHQPARHSRSQKKVLEEMEEALRELRHERGIRRVLLSALDGQEMYH